MKKKKQKLIIAIAIILIVVILTIVISTNVINNSKIANEAYFDTTENANSNLIASYIKKGKKIGEITGTLEVLDTSDANATPEDIAYGKTGYVNGEKIIGTYVPSNNYTFTDNLENEIKVPGGFVVVNPEDNVTDGIIIEDVSAGDENTKGSQFVWIPVGDVITDANGSTTKIELGRYTFEDDGTENLVQSAENGNWNKEVSIEDDNLVYKELPTSYYGILTAKSLEDFVIKTLSSGGYYIGRYEAGNPKKNEIDQVESESPMVCKSGVYPYNWVTPSEASSLCQKMYSSGNFESDLINSYAWDTAIVFIQTFSGDINYSRQAGKNTKSALQKCGESVLDSVDSGDKAQDVRCNIFDMSGNAWEWTTETCFSDDGVNVKRGGTYENFYTYSRLNDFEYEDQLKAFRCTLYL